jgi:hypothetical protein
MEPDAIAATNSDRNEPVLTAPEAADHIFRICASCLLGLDHASLGPPRSFRVYSGSWKLPRDCLYLAGDGTRPVRAGSGLALGF